MAEPRGAAELITASEAAERFGVDPATIARWEREQELRPVRTAGRTLYRAADLERLATAEPAPPPEAPPARRERPAGIGAERTRARRRALEILHAADVTGVDPLAALPPQTDPFARALVEGVVRHRDELDSVIRERAEHWTLERMPVVDRNILRLAIFELLHSDVATGTIIDQAVTLAKLLSTEESGRFVNGILGRIARDRRS